MNSIIKLISFGLMITTSLCFAENQIERSPLMMGSGFEFGQIIKGKEYETDFEAKAAPFYRLGVYLTQKYTANRQFELSMGVGGLFYSIFPNLPSLPFTENVRFGPGITVAEGVYHFGDIDKRNLFLKFGFFPVKYNENATNLGEYLFRSTTYPGLLYTGGPGSWSIVNSAHYMGQGAQLHWSLLDGDLTQDLTLFFERDYAPMLDLTPSYLVKLKMGGIVELGFGASFNHYIPMRPSRMRPNPSTGENHYVTISGVPPMEGSVTATLENGKAQLDTLIPDFSGGELSGMWMDLQAYGYKDANGNDILTSKVYKNTFDPAAPDVIANTRPRDKVWLDQVTDAPIVYDSIPDLTDNLWWDTGNQVFIAESSLPADRSAFDSLGVKRYVEQPEQLVYDEGTYVYPRTDYYFTYQGIKLMGIASLDFKPLFGNPDILGPKDLTLFAELAVLGVQDQPLFYDNIKERMPLMFGMHLPAFKLLDLLSVQFQYFNNPWPNDSRNLTYLLVPTYTVDNVDSYQPIRSDDWRWSVFAKKKWQYGNFLLQVASDHMRTIWYENVPTYRPVTNRFTDWYYTLKFEYGM